MLFVSLKLSSPPSLAVQHWWRVALVIRIEHESGFTQEGAYRSHSNLQEASHSDFVLKMPYRVETAKTGRAGCSVKKCKDAGLKIEKGELRFGSWVDTPNFSSWSWRHWGCVTGQQIEHLRDTLADPDRPDGYNWELLDGYESDDRGSLVHHPDLQDKVRRVIMQGYIDPEDFNGDPEMNELGKRGLYLGSAQKRKKEEDAARAAAEGEDSEDAKPAKKKRAIKAKKEVDEDGDEVKPVKKPRAKKAKKEEENKLSESGEENVTPTPVKRSRVKKTVKQEDEQTGEGNEKDLKPAPANESRAKKAVKQEAEQMNEGGNKEAKPAPTKRSRAKKGRKEEQMDEGMEEEVKPAPAKKSRAKKAVKQEDEQMGEGNDEEAEPAPAKSSRAKKVKQEAGENGDEIGEVAKAKPATKKGHKAVKDEPSEDIPMTAPESSNAVIAEGSGANTTLPGDPQAVIAVKGELSEDANLASVPHVEEQASEPATAVKGELSENVNLASAPNVKKQAPEGGSQATEAAVEEETESQTKKRGGRGKKG
ncbi:poly polymerase and DNA-ligase Zn-finger region-domain-containing protein [Hyaloscypha finlandica]|nr:poly polymerase and DNA-ligase Zn-finger region-domain-containing protein [Hyaloscypha finlandica]